MPNLTPQLGVIEGFYGRPWPHAMRLRMLSWLKALAFDAYLYAPKADPFLRKSWQRPWPLASRRELGELVAKGRAVGVDVFVGLSPFAVYENLNTATRESLRRRVDEIVSLGAGGMGLFFDDMPGNCNELAMRQAEVIEWVRELSRGLSLTVCPTYYSDDPVLDRFFGPRPDGYLEDLAKNIDASVTLLWTGPEVCSTAIPAQSIAELTACLGVSIGLWDNYPVNDSKTRSEHIYTQPLSGREAALAPLLRSHWCNAMNQPTLSLPALASLPAVYGRKTPALQQAFAEAGLSDDMLNALGPLAQNTFGALQSEERAVLGALAERDTPASRELQRWIAGYYEFDPDCLTD